MTLLGRMLSAATPQTVREVSRGSGSKEIQCSKDEKPSSKNTDLYESSTPRNGWQLKEILKTNWKFLVVVVFVLLGVIAYSLLVKRGITIIMPIFIYPGFMISGCSFLVGVYRRGSGTTVECIHVSKSTPPKEEQNTKSESDVKVTTDTKITSNVQPNVSSAPPPPPPPPTPSPSNKKLVVECRKLLWDVVGHNSLSSDTIWSKISSSLSAEEIIDVRELSSLFGVSRPTLPKKAIKVLTAKQSIMGTKKKLNIAISLAHTKLPSDKVIAALLCGKPDLPTDLLETLLKFSPNEIEESALKKQGKTDPSLFGDVERFYFKIISKIPTYKERLRTMLLKAQLQERINNIQPHLQTIIVASDEVRQSSLLREFLQFVLTVGNFMNRSKTRGFKISFLGKLISIKSNVDKKTTFLDFIVKGFKASHPNMIKMIKELSHVNAAAKINFKHLEFEINELSGELKVLDNDVKKINNSKELETTFKENVRVFVEHVHQKFQSLIALRNTATTSLEETLEFFGEGRGTTITNEQFFGTVTTFLRHLEESLKKQQ